jgi:FkbM family methyltransferase
MVYGDYEGSGFLNWVRSNVPPTGVIVDSGANIGQMAVYFGVVVGGGRVYAFEPGPAQFAWLTECLTRNPHLPITPLQIGLSDNSRTAFLSNDGNTATHGSWSKVSENEGERIRLTTLDEFLTQSGIRHVHLWKLDMEGHEFNALKGASRALEAGLIGALYVEISGESGRKIAAFLSTFGYSPFYPDEKGVIHPALEWNNYDNVLFARSP